MVSWEGDKVCRYSRVSLLILTFVERQPNHGIDMEALPRDLVSSHSLWLAGSSIKLSESAMELYWKL